MRRTTSLLRLRVLERRGGAGRGEGEGSPKSEYVKETKIIIKIQCIYLHWGPVLKRNNRSFETSRTRPGF